MSEDWNLNHHCCENLTSHNWVEFGNNGKYAVELHFSGLNGTAGNPDKHRIQIIGFLLENTGLFKMIFGVLTTCHTQYTWDKSIWIFLFNRTTLQVFVTYLTGALYVHPLWFYKHQHENRVLSKLFAAWQRWWFQWRFWFVPSVPGEMHNYCTPHIIKENFENFLIH